MERGVKRRTRRRSPLPFLLLAVVVVGCGFAAAVVWCVLNRVDAEGWPDTVAEVVTQPHQFAGYSPDYPATEEFKAIAADVLIRWEREKREGGEVGRVLPAEYVFFTGDGEVNHFRTEYKGGMFWDWSLKNPYSS